MVPSADTGTVASTGRNCSSAVSPTSCRARSLSFTPGISTRMLLPCRDTWASATPKELMRWLMMLMASSSESDEGCVPLGGASTTDTPPCRSRPRNGRLVVKIV